MELFKKYLMLIFRIVISLQVGKLILFLVVNAFFNYSNLNILLINISLILLCVILVINFIWIKNKHKKKFLLLGTFLVITIIALSAYNDDEDAKEEELTLDSNIMSININEYMPFEKKSKIVKAKNSSLKLQENLPIVDGAAALFPVYSAFVNAVYPENVVKEEIQSIGIASTEIEDGRIVSTTGTSYILDRGVFQYNNTVEGYKKLAQKETDIFFGAYPSKEQIAYADKNNTTLEFTPIGREGFVFFVNEKNPIDNLTSDEIRDIYSGKITNWKEVGGRNKKILAFQRNEGSGSQSMLIRFMDGVKLKEPIKKEQASSMSIIVDDVADYQNYNNSIGFSFRYYAEDIMQNQNVKLLSVDGIAPTVENISNGTYPITTDFYAVTYKENENPNVDKFIEWILSEEGQYIIEKTGYARISK